MNIHFKLAQKIDFAKFNPFRPFSYFLILKN